MIGDSFTFPTAGEEAGKTIVIGGVLTFFGVFVLITVIPVYGYLLRVLRAAMNNDPDPPRFDDWESLLVDGLKVLVVGLVYLGIPAVLFMFGLLILLAGAISSGEGSLRAGFGVLMLLYGVMMALVFLVALYLLPAALANMAYHDDIGAAFDTGAVIDGATSVGYVVATLVASIIYAVLAPIGSIFLLVIVGGFLLFWVQVVTTHMVGRGFARGRGMDNESGGTDVSAASAVD